jgi:pimeloyl-ACP methyl ester carboxylesterase
MRCRRLWTLAQAAPRPAVELGVGIVTASARPPIVPVAQLPAGTVLVRGVSSRPPDPRATPDGPEGRAPAAQPSGIPDAKVDAHVEAMLEAGAMTAAINYYRALRPRRILAVGRITVPTLYVWSTSDVALSEVAARARAGQVGGPYRFEVMDGGATGSPRRASTS